MRKKTQISSSWPDMDFWREYRQMRAQDELIYDPLHTNDIVIENYLADREFLLAFSDLGEKKPIPLAAHSYLEFLYSDNETPVEYIIGHDRYHVTRGDLIMLNSYTPHCLLVPAEGIVKYRRYGLLLNADFFQKVIQGFPDQRSKNFIKNDVIHMDEVIFEQIIEAFQEAQQEMKTQKINWHMYTVGLALQILTLTVRAGLNPCAVPEEKNELVDQILAFIEKNYMGKITLQDIADHLYSSKSTISHTFKETMGIGTYAYITRRRLLTAYELINKGMSATEASETVGFSDYASFLRLFKTTYGISPRELKKKKIETP